jgi:GT2 family glycosyltransferase
LLNRFTLRTYQITPQGGLIYVDRKVEKWLDSFKSGNFSGKSEQELEIYRSMTTSCLKEDSKTISPDPFPQVSIILVTYNSSQWMNNLNEMFSDLMDWVKEVIVVDNGSSDGCIQLLKKAEKIKVIQNEQPGSYASAVNQACKCALGELLFLMNPDVMMTRNTLFSMVNFYQDHLHAAAIVPKLLLMRTPGFLNGIGNAVPLFLWGYDLGLGHLDLGQFDDIHEVPSACFAAVLIPKEKWILVGELDEGYPMYYEDSDWSYRARSLGFQILANPKAKVLHAFTASQGPIVSISQSKLTNATYGRLRFIAKIDQRRLFIPYLLSYILFDILYFLYNLIRRKERMSLSQALVEGWKQYVRGYSEIKKLKYRFPKLDGKRFQELKPTIYKGLPVVVWGRQFRRK